MYRRRNPMLIAFVILITGDQVSQSLFAFLNLLR